MKTLLSILYVVFGIVMVSSAITALFSLYIVVMTLMSNIPVADIIVEQGINYTPSEVFLSGIIAIPICIIAILVLRRINYLTEEFNTYRIK